MDLFKMAMTRTSPRIEVYPNDLSSGFTTTITVGDDTVFIKTYEAWDETYSGIIIKLNGYLLYSVEDDYMTEELTFVDVPQMIGTAIAILSESEASRGENGTDVKKRLTDAIENLSFQA